MRIQRFWSAVLMERAEAEAPWQDAGGFGDEPLFTHAEEVGGRHETTSKVLPLGTRSLVGKLPCT